MELWRSLAGMVEAELTGADPESSLQDVVEKGICVYDTRKVDDLTVCFCLHRSDCRRLRTLTEKSGDRLRYIRRVGLYWTGKQLLKRPVLLAGITLILLLTLFLPSRVFFVEVEGNSAVPSRLILERAQDCGIVFGAKRHKVRSEKIKNALLQSIPELQWAGINTYGCRAVISVRERTTPQKPQVGSGVSSIVAARDGVIRGMTVLKGTPCCTVGQAVKTGQVLISGYADLGLCIRATRAEGEVFAETKRELMAVMPTESLLRSEIIGLEKKYGLIIGKKQINFYKDSGISDTSCDKMYSVKYITLPGGLSLPVAIVTETWIHYEMSASALSEETAEAALSEFSSEYLSGSMTAGQIIQRDETLEWSEGLCALKGRYACLEMIGKTRLEENLNNYGQTD